MHLITLTQERLSGRKEMLIIQSLKLKKGEYVSVKF